VLWQRPPSAAAEDRNNQAFLTLDQKAA